MSLVDMVRLFRPIEFAASGIHLQIEPLGWIQLRVAENMLSFWYIAGNQVQQPIDFFHFSALRPNDLHEFSSSDPLRVSLYNSYRRRNVPWRKVEEQESYKDGHRDYWSLPDSIHGHGRENEEHKVFPKGDDSIWKREKRVFSGVPRPKRRW